MLIENIAAKIAVSLAMKLAKPAVEAVRNNTSSPDTNQKATEVTKTFNEIYDFMKSNIKT